MKAEESVSRPLLLLTTTSTAPAAWAGVVQVKVVAFTTFRAVAGMPSKVTVVSRVVVK